jgi:hypothetical protein
VAGDRWPGPVSGTGSGFGSGSGRPRCWHESVGQVWADAALRGGREEQHGKRHHLLHTESWNPGIRRLPCGRRVLLSSPRADDLSRFPASLNASSCQIPRSSDEDHQPALASSVSPWGRVYDVERADPGPRKSSGCIRS